MARLYGEDQNAWLTTPPRKPTQAPGDYLKDDTYTGNAAHDGCTIVSRRPWDTEAHSAGWMPEEKAREYEKTMSDFPPPFDG